MSIHAKRQPRKPGLTAQGKLPDALKNADSLPDSALVSQPVIEGLAGCSAATVWRRVKSGLLPKPIRQGGCTRWRLGEVRAALGAV